MRKKREYKKVEDIVIYFNNKVWKALHKFTEVEGERANYIFVKENKIKAVYYGYIRGCEGWGEYDEENDQVITTIPNRLWKPCLESFGYFCKNRKVYYGKYKENKIDRERINSLPQKLKFMV